jgi:hypothetical protein
LPGGLLLAGSCEQAELWLPAKGPSPVARLLMIVAAPCPHRDYRDALGVHVIINSLSGGSAGSPLLARSNRAKDAEILIVRYKLAVP